MNRVLLIRYGEIGLKGRNRSQFEDQLQRNMETALSRVKGYSGSKVSKSWGRFYVTHLDADLERECLEALSNVPGIVGISPGVVVEKDLESIKNAAVALLEKDVLGARSPVTFKISARRADKSFSFTSPEINRLVGAAALESIPQLAVNVHNPSIHVIIEIRRKHAYIYRNQVPGPGGLPVGVSGKGILLISGGIDSPVAGYMAMKRGVALDALHFWSYPITGYRARSKVVELCKILGKHYTGLRLFIAPFTEIQTEIMNTCPEKFRVIIMRRMMMRVASRLCKKVGGMAIFTGENLGQVASQTLESLSVIEDASDFPVLRPLICFDKVETVRVAQQIGTYHTSILPFEDCCTVFVPKHPVTRPRLDLVLKMEERMEVDALTERCVRATEVADLDANI